MTKILYLNGPSSSGKTSLVKALQEVLPEPYLHIGIDKIIGFMPAKLNNWEGGAAPDGFSWIQSTDSSGHPIHDLHAGPFAKRIIQSFKDITLLLASQGYNLIIDDVAFGATEVGEWKKLLRDRKVLYVGLVAPLQVLEQRERERGNRMIGSARSQYFKVHENVAYDLEIDTHAFSMEENIARIIRAFGQASHFTVRQGSEGKMHEK